MVTTVALLPPRPILEALRWEELDTAAAAASESPALPLGLPWVIPGVGVEGFDPMLRLERSFELGLPERDAEVVLSSC